MRISIIGTGYVGLVSGVCLASVGHEVVCVDIDAAKVDAINRGECPIYERDLPQLLRQVLGRGFRATADLRCAVLQSDLTMIAVGTPFDGSKIDLTYVERAARQIGAALREKDGYHTVVVKSTVVPGTTEGLVLRALREESGKQEGSAFGLGMNPEFLREGEAVQDFIHPDRIVLGGIDERSVEALERVYEPFHAAERVRTSTRTAEMIKYASNAFLATLISFSNEIGNLCAASGAADVRDVLRGVHLDKRLSPFTGHNRDRIYPEVTSYLAAGCGFGGSCFPKDVKALIAYAAQSGARMPILEAVMHINERQPLQVVRLLEKHFPSLTGVCVAILGLAFKPGTNDLRESPAIAVIRALLHRGAIVRAYDPIAAKDAEAELGSDGIAYCDSVREAITGADAVALLTRWQEFDALPRLLSAMPSPPLLVDGRRMIPKTAVPRYEGVGL